MNEEIKQYLETKFRELEAKILIQQKRVLNTDEAALYIGISKYTLYQMTSKGAIPFSRPEVKGKPSRYIYFDRLALDEWLLSNKSEVQPTTVAMIQKAANQVLFRKSLHNFKETRQWNRKSEKA